MKRLTFELPERDSNTETFRVRAMLDGKEIGHLEIGPWPAQAEELHQIYAEGHARAVQAFAWEMITIARLYEPEKDPP